MVVVFVVLINDKQPGQVRSGTETSSGELVNCFNQQRSRVGRSTAAGWPSPMTPECIHWYQDD